MIDFGTSISTESGTGADGMLQQGSGSVLHTFSQDGYSPGTLTGIAMTEEREIIGRYDNGETKILGQGLPIIARHPVPGNHPEDRKQRKGIKEISPLPTPGIPRTTYAVQSGIWTVGQVGSWHVNVDNNSEHPIPVQDVSLGKREPWTHTQPFQFQPENFSAGEILLDVPPAKSLVIQHVSLQSTAWDTLEGITHPQLIASLHANFQNLPVTHQFGLADIFRIDSGEHQQVRHVLSKTVSLYADSNSQLRVIVERNYGGRQQDGTVTLTGYLEPNP